MEERSARIAQELEWFCMRLGSDFGAIARPVKDRPMKWTYLTGSSNARVHQMTLKRGTGVAGMVLRHGTAYRVDEAENAAIAEECPVMLAERLLSAVAFPVPAREAEESAGVLLIGRRSGRRYAEQDIRLAYALLSELAEMMEAR